MNSTIYTRQYLSLIAAQLADIPFSGLPDEADEPHAYRVQDHPIEFDWDKTVVYFMPQDELIDIVNKHFPPGSVSAADFDRRLPRQSMLAWLHNTGVIHWYHMTVDADDVFRCRAFVVTDAGCVCLPMDFQIGHPGQIGEPIYLWIHPAIKSTPSGDALREFTLRIVPAAMKLIVWLSENRQPNLRLDTIYVEDGQHRSAVSRR